MLWNSGKGSEQSGASSWHLMTSHDISACSSWQTPLRPRLKHCQSPFTASHFDGAKTVQDDRWDSFSMLVSPIMSSWYPQLPAKYGWGCSIVPPRIKNPSISKSLDVFFTIFWFFEWHSPHVYIYHIPILSSLDYIIITSPWMIKTQSGLLIRVRLLTDHYSDLRPHSGESMKIGMIFKHIQIKSNDLRILHFAPRNWPYAWSWRTWSGIRLWRSDLCDGGDQAKYGTHMEPRTWT